MPGREEVNYDKGSKLNMTNVLCVSLTDSDVGKSVEGFVAGCDSNRHRMFSLSAL